ncbi:hypothetical protein H2248_000503 [Termitomyces sp. 'cryptogamus']|nr:hypothetical protein H2248_000503 [Termitomyces sp. 'cryptogamus']
MAELTGLCQTTEAVSLSLQALLEHLPLAPTMPPMPPADAELFVSAPSSGFLALAAAEWFVSASCHNPFPEAPCHDPSPGPPHIVQQPPNSPKNPPHSAELPPMPHAYFG